MLKRKQIIGALSIVSLVSIIFSSVSAEYNYSEDKVETNNGYQEAVLDSSIEFKAERDGKTVKMEWTNYNHSDFQYYKVMRSETHTNPVYPDQPAIRVIDNNDITEAKVDNYSQNSAIYRVCVITDERERKCSNVVKLEGFDKEAFYKEEKAKYVENKETYINKTKIDKKQYVQTTKAKMKSKLSDRLATKANQVIERFTKKIESKITDNSKRAVAFEKIMEKLESLAAKNSKFRDLVDHLNMKLKEKVESYNDGFEEIEDIFNSID